jgi:hypothetical protein
VPEDDQGDPSTVDMESNGVDILIVGRYGHFTTDQLIDVARSVISSSTR